MIEESIEDNELVIINDMKKNYINYLALLVASNINSIYNRFQNKYETSMEEVINTSKDIIVLTKKDEEILYKSIIKILKNEYNLNILSEDKLILEKF